MFNYLTDTGFTKMDELYSKHGKKYLPNEVWDIHSQTSAAALLKFGDV